MRKRRVKDINFFRLNFHIPISEKINFLPEFFLMELVSYP